MRKTRRRHSAHPRTIRLGYVLRRIYKYLKKRILTLLDPPEQPNGENGTFKFGYLVSDFCDKSLDCRSGGTSPVAQGTERSDKHWLRVECQHPL